MPYNLYRETPRSGILVLCGEIGFEFGRRHVAECGAKPLSVVDFLQEVANRQLGFVQIAVVAAENSSYLSVFINDSQAALSHGLPLRDMLMPIP